MNKLYIIIFSAFLIFSCKNEKKIFSVKNGDLLFQDSDCGSFCDAIEKVTSGYKGKNISHVGIVKIINEKIYVLEAISEGVVLTNFTVFLNRSFDKNGKPKVIVGRLKKKYQNLIPKFLENYKKFLGKKYDFFFDYKNEAYYCSELVYEIFSDKNNKKLFHLKKMTFIDPETKKTFPIWEEYFKNLNYEIPEGKLGTNPADISKSKKIEIIHFYGIF